MFNRILEAWQSEMLEINKKPWMQRLASGDFKISHYKGYLLETFHHTGINPQIQAYATMFFKNNPREIVDLFCKHARSEIGHDMAAMNDLEALGEDRKELERTHALPSTIALNAFVLMQIQFVDPIAYLGYLFHLEFMPTRQGKRHMEELQKLGIPKEALSFLQEHATVDVGHNKMMESYVALLVNDEDKLETVIRATRYTAQLHYKMMADAFENGEKLFSNAIGPAVKKSI